MAKTFEIAFKIGASIAGGFAQTMRGAAGSLDALNGQLKNISNQKSANKQLMDLRKTVANSSRDYIQAKNKVAALGAELSNTVNPTKAMQNEFKRAEQAVSKAKNKLTDQRNELKKLNTSMGATGKTTAQLVAEQNKLTRSGDKAKRAQEGLQKTMAAQQQNLSNRANYRGQMMDTAALALMAGAPIKMAMDWEQNLAEFNKVADLTDAQLVQRSKEIQKIAVDTGVSMDQLAGAYTSASLGGLDPKEWEKFAVTAAKMGVAMDVTGDQAGDFLMKWQAGMGLSLDQAIDLADMVNYLGNEMKNVAAADLAGVLQRQGSVLQAAGLDTSNSASVMAAMLSGGAREEVAATAAKNFGNALTKSFTATKMQRDIWAGMGFTPEQLSKGMQENAEGTIQHVLRAIRGQDADKQNAIVGALFGEESKGAIMPLIQNVELLDQAFGLLGKGDYVGSLEKEFDAMGKTTQQQLKKMQQGTKAVSIALGASLLPAINKVLATIAPYALKVAEWAQENETLVTTVVGVASALVAAKVAALALGYGFTFLKGAALSVIKPIQIMRTAFLLNTGAMQANTTTSKSAVVASKAMSVAMRAGSAVMAVFNGVLLATPVGWIIAAVAAIAAVGVLLWKKWDLVVAFFKGAWQGFKEGLQPIFEMFSFLTPVVDALGVAFEWVTEKLKVLIGWFSKSESSTESLQKASSYGLEFGRAISFAFKLMLTPIRSVISAFNLVISYAPKMWEWGRNIFISFGEGIKSAWTWVIDSISSLWGSVVSFFQNFSFYETGKNILITLGNGILGIGSFLIDSAKNAWSSVTSFFDNFSLYESGMRIMETIGDGIKAAANSVVDSVKGVFATIREYLPFSDAKIGPLSELTASGYAIMSTLAEGMEKYDPAAMGDSFKKVSQQFTGFIPPSVTGQVNHMIGDNRSGGFEASYARSSGRDTAPLPEINITQHITVNGDGGKNVFDQAKKGAAAGAADFEKRIAKMLNRDRRVSYG